MRRLFLFIFAVFAACTQSPQGGVQQVSTNLTAYETEVLTECFRRALTESQLAAVLYGEKPVCIDGVCVEWPVPNICQGARWLVNGELYAQGLAIWERHGFSGENWSFLRAGSSSLRNELPSLCLWVNHKALLDVVDRHLSLFRMILGSHVTPEFLLAKLTTPGVQFLELFANNEVLIGLVLGFGLENSLIHQSLTDLRLFFAARETVPLRARRERIPSAHIAQRELAVPGMAWVPAAVDEDMLLMRYDFEDIYDEYRRLDDRIILSCDHPLTEGYNIPWFGCDPDSRETEELIRNYVTAAKKAEQVMEEPHFIDLVLGRLCS